MVDLILNILALTISLLFVRYIAYYIVYLCTKFIKFISKGKIDIKLHTITIDDVLCTTMMCLILTSIFKSVGII